MRRVAALAACAAALSLRPARAEALPVVEPSAALGLDVAYDSNIYNGRGPDMVTRLSPHLSLKLRDLRGSLTLTYNLGLWDYALGKARPSLNQTAALVAQEQLTRRLSLKVADELVSAQDPAYLTRAGVIAPQTGILDNLAEGQLGFRVTRRFELAVAYSYHHTTFDQPAPPSPPLFDGDQHDGLVSFGFRAGRRDDLRFTARAQYFTVSGDPLAITESSTLGWRHQILPTLELTLEGGPLLYEGRTAARRIPEGFAGTALSWRGAALLRYVRYPVQFAVSALHDLMGGTGAGSVLWADYAGTQASVHLTRTLEVRGAVNYFANGFAPARPRRFDGVSVDALLDWRALPNLDLGGYYSFRWQEAADAGFPSLTRHIAGVRLQVLFGAEAAPARREVHP